MTEVVGVKFRGQGKVYYFSPEGIEVSEGTDVIVETSRGIEYGSCVSGREMVEDSMVVQPLRPVVRLATDQDKKSYQENRAKEPEALEACQRKVLEHGLDMKLVDVEYSFDGSKILFFFTSDGRVDFRELVKDLASVFRTRIELRQIGVRDEAKMLGGLGICGRPFCCASFLDDFQPVSIKMAKSQSLSLNPTKISGTCGRLMCCLKYEQDSYERMIKGSPRLESLVKTKDGRGTVVDVNLLKEEVKVRLEGETDPTVLKSYKIERIAVIRNGKKRGEEPEEYEDPELPDFPEDEKKPEEAFSFFDAVPQSAEKPREPQRQQQRPRERQKPRTRPAEKPAEEKPAPERKEQPAEKKPVPRQNQHRRKKPPVQKPAEAKPQTPPQSEGEAPKPKAPHRNYHRRPGRKKPPEGENKQ